MIQQTSIRAYQHVQQTGKDNVQQNQILQYLSIHPWSTDKETSISTGLNINAVTARRNELFKKGLIKQGQKRHCTVTHRTALTWRTK